MIFKIIKETSKVTNILAAQITKELVGEPEVDKAKYKAKEKIKELEKLLQEKKDRLHRDYYFSIKSKINSFHSELSRIRNLDKLKKLEEEVKKYIEEIKKRAK